MAGESGARGEKDGERGRGSSETVGAGDSYRDYEKKEEARGRRRRGRALHYGKYSGYGTEIEREKD